MGKATQTAAITEKGGILPATGNVTRAGELVLSTETKGTTTTSTMEEDTYVVNHIQAHLSDWIKEALQTQFREYPICGEWPPAIVTYSETS